MPKIFTEADWETLRRKLMAASCGIVKGTFYHFFPSREAFFREIAGEITAGGRRPALFPGLFGELSHLDGGQSL